MVVTHYQTAAKTHCIWSYFMYSLNPRHYLPCPNLTLIQFSISISLALVCPYSQFPKFRSLHHYAWDRNAAALIAITFQTFCLSCTSISLHNRQNGAGGCRARAIAVDETVRRRSAHFICEDLFRGELLGLGLERVCVLESKLRTVECEICA